MRSSKLTNSQINKLIGQYDYEFPSELIAQAPADPRDSAGLLVYDRKTKRVCWDVFANITDYLPKQAVLVLNRTKVIPARLLLNKKKTGGRVKMLYLGRAEKGIKALADRSLAIGEELCHSSGREFRVKVRNGGEYEMEPLFPIRELMEVLDEFGETPIPPYIKHTPLREAELRREYQTVFAQKAGSVAAPTASLHFTQELLEKIKRAGIEIAYVTLHVNLGTFAPLKEDHIREGRLHSEEYEITGPNAKKINQALQEGRQVIAAGTTVVRTLEAAGENGRVKVGKGRTDIFIREDSSLKVTGGLITNFHVPRSSLMMLVSAFVGRKKLLELYREAIARKFRLFSFGDAMLIK